jgi:hypothetical protein
MRTRVGRTWAYLLRGLGLAIALAGLIVTIASLSRTWATDGFAKEGNLVARSGWDYLGAGGAALVAVCLFVAVIAVALTFGPRSRKVSRSAGALALTPLVLGLATIGVLDWLSGLDFSFFTDSDDVHHYVVKSGFEVAAIGMAVAILGVLILLAGRWDARTRASLKRERRSGGSSSEAAAA